MFHRQSNDGKYMAASTHTEMAVSSAQEKLEKVVGSMMTTQNTWLGLMPCDNTISQKKATYSWPSLCSDFILSGKIALSGEKK